MTPWAGLSRIENEWCSLTLCSGINNRAADLFPRGNWKCICTFQHWAHSPSHIIIGSGESNENLTHSEKTRTGFTEERWGTQEARTDWSKSTENRKRKACGRNESLHAWLKARSIWKPGCFKNRCFKRNKEVVKYFRKAHKDLLKQS